MIREVKNRNKSLISVLLGDLRGARTEDHQGHIWGPDEVSMGMQSLERPGEEGEVIQTVMSNKCS